MVGKGDRNERESDKRDEKMKWKGGWKGAEIKQEGG